MKYDRQSLELAAWCGAFLLAALWALLVFEYPAGQDIPNHLARIFILLNSQDPAIAPHFNVNWAPIPDLAWDVFGVVFGRFLSLAWTLKLYLALSFVATMGGVFMLNRALVGRWSWPPLLATPFTFHAGYAKGFLSFNLGIGLALMASALWVSVPEAHWRRRLLLAALFSVILYYTHLVAWGVYGLFVLGYQLYLLVSQWRAAGRDALVPWLWRTLRDGTQALPPLLIALTFMLLGGQGAELVGRIASVDNPLSRIKGARYIITTGLTLPGLFFLIVAVGLLFYLLLWKKAVKFSPKYGFSIALLVLFFFITPDQIYSTHFIVWRMALAATLVAIASGISTFAINSAVARVSLVLFLVLTLGLSGWFAHVTYNSEGIRKEFIASIDRIPEGQTLFAVHAGIKATDIEYDRIGAYHLGSYAIFLRKVMTQSQFANPAQQPITYRDAPFSDIKVNGGRFLNSVEKKFKKMGLPLDDYLSAFQWISLYKPSDRPGLTDAIPQNFAPAGTHGPFLLFCRVESLNSASPVCPDGRAP